MITLTRSLAKALAPQIRVNAIAPGIVTTRWVAGREEHVERYARDTPLERARRPRTWRESSSLRRLTGPSSPVRSRSSTAGGRCAERQSGWRGIRAWSPAQPSSGRARRGGIGVGIRATTLGEWVDPAGMDLLERSIPPPRSPIARVVLSSKAGGGAGGGPGPGRLSRLARPPPVERAFYLFRLKELMEGQFETRSATDTQDHGKTLEDARGEVRRAIENVEVACGIPTLMMRLWPGGRGGARHRRARHPAAAGGLRRHLPLQLPGDGAVLVPGPTPSPAATPTSSSPASRCPWR